MTLDTARLGLQQILDALRVDAALYEDHAKALTTLTAEGRTFEALATQARRTIEQLDAVRQQLDARSDDLVCPHCGKPYPCQAQP